jgi:mannose-6-phosphate isomerase-like protein (cupin superfamily)
MDLKNIQDSIVFNDKTLTKRILFATPEVLCFILNLKVGQSLPIHKHENSGLIYHVLSGNCDIKINDEISAISAGAVGFAKGQDDFSIPTVKEDLSLYVTISPNPSNELYSKGHG